MEMKIVKHKYRLLIFIGSLVIGNVNAQSSYNYVKIYKAQKAIVGDLSIYENKDSVAVATTYYDGLGREIQSVHREQSPDGYDIVSFSAYDDYARKSSSFLSYVTMQPVVGLIPDPVSDQKSFYINLFGESDGKAALSENVIEHSDLARVIEQSAPGADWQVGEGHTIKRHYLTNTSLDSIRHFVYKDGSVSKVSFYPINSLSCVKTIDEHGNDSFEFFDKEGRVVCQKVKATNTVYAITYYVYDDFGNLVLVIPPEGTLNSKL